jgi:hypothetical protein
MRRYLFLSRPSLSARLSLSDLTSNALTFPSNPRTERLMTFILVVGSRTAGAG